MKRARAGTIHFLRWLMAASVALPIVLFMYASWLNYNAIHRAADERIDRSLTIVQENAAHVLGSAELLIAGANTIAGARSDDEIRAQEREIHNQLAQLTRPLREAQSVWLFAADGSPLVSSDVFPIPRTFVNTDRDYFQAQVGRDAGLAIGAVVPPKVPGKEIFVASRRRPGQGFNGVTAVAIRPVNTEAFYRAIGNFPGSYYALIRDDGAFLARYPEPAQRGLKLTSASSTMQSIAKNPDSGINSLTSQTDAVERRMGYRKIANYPVYALAAIERQAIVAEWIGVMVPHIVFGVPATAIMFFALYYGLRRTQRLYMEAEAREIAESALRQTQKMESIGQLTGGVAHDFNNLLTIIIGNLDMARRAVDRGIDTSILRLSEAIDNAQRGAQRAATLTQRLLAFARQQPLQPRVVDINSAVREASSLLRRAIGENYELDVVCAAGAWNIEVDLSQLEVTLVNLAVNARDAMEDAGKLSIETGSASLDEAYCDNHEGLKPGQYATISVSDNGPGMTSEVLARAFEPFFTTKAAGRGTGLGLSQVYGFMKQSGGHVSLYSEMGNGVTVKLYFPRVQRDPDKLDVRRSSVTSGDGQRILVVEDDEDLRRFVAETLVELNYTASAAANAEQALALVETSPQPFHAVLTDVVMPGLNGRQLADRLALLSPSTQVVFMTGYSRNAIVHHGRLDSGVRLLQKPFSRDELADQLRRLWL